MKGLSKNLESFTIEGFQEENTSNLLVIHIIIVLVAVNNYFETYSMTVNVVADVNTRVIK